MSQEYLKTPISTMSIHCTPLLLKPCKAADHKEGGQWPAAQALVVASPWTIDQPNMPTIPAECVANKGTESRSVRCYTLLAKNLSANFNVIIWGSLALSVHFCSSQ